VTEAIFICLGYMFQPRT